MHRVLFALAFIALSGAALAQNVWTGGGGGGAGITCPTNFTASGASCIWTVSQASGANCPGATSCIFFTGLTGNHYTLRCANLLGGNTTSTVSLQYGEGAGPTWQTASSYRSQGTFQTQGTAPQSGSSGAAGPTIFGIGNMAASGGVGVTFDMNLYNLASTTKNKVASGMWFASDAVPTYYEGFVGGVFIGDTAAITSLRVADTQATPTTVTGTCTLYYNGV